MRAFEPFNETVERASEALPDLEYPALEIWDGIASYAEQFRNDERHQDLEYLDPENFIPTNDCPNVSSRKVTQSMSSSITLQQNIKTDSEYYRMVRNLRSEQKIVDDIIVKHCRQLKLYSTKKIVTNPNPFYVFLSGGAGVGKSFLIHKYFKHASKN